jgi:hypothetical protein
MTYENLSAMAAALNKGVEQMGKDIEQRDEEIRRLEERLFEAKKAVWEAKDALDAGNLAAVEDALRRAFRA